MSMIMKCDACDDTEARSFLRISCLAGTARKDDHVRTLHVCNGCASLVPIGILDGVYTSMAPRDVEAALREIGAQKARGE